MKCRIKDVECEHAGTLVYYGCKEFGEREGRHECGICYNDKIGRDISKCKMEKKIYISGPISGHNLEERRKAFKEIQEHLEAQGYNVINPMENGLPAEATSIGLPVFFEESGEITKFE